MERAMAGIAMWAAKPAHTRQAVNEDWETMDTSLLFRVTATFDEAMKKVRAFSQGESPPVVALYLNSPQKKALEWKESEDRKAEIRSITGAGSKRNSGSQSSSRDRDTKKQHTIESSTAAAQKKLGDIIFTGTGTNNKMPLPTLPEGSRRPCGPHYRHGYTCRFGDACKYDHTSIDDLDAASQKAWHALVTDTEGMMFNTRRVKGVATLNGKKIAKETAAKSTSQE
jgi:hypothetical protein